MAAAYIAVNCKHITRDIRIEETRTLAQHRQGHHLGCSPTNQNLCSLQNMSLLSVVVMVFVQSNNIVFSTSK